VADDLSSATISPRGIDMVAGTVGRFTRGGPLASTSSGAVTTTATFPGVEVAGAGQVRLDLVTTAAPTTYTVAVETSFDNGATDAWRNVTSFPAQTAAGTVRAVSAGLDRWVRAHVTAITGSATFTLSGEAI
jgi:hypothetical protein